MLTEMYSTICDDNDNKDYLYTLLNICYNMKILENISAHITTILSKSTRMKIQSMHYHCYPIQISATNIVV